MCKVKARLGRKKVVLQTIGYRGRREARTHLGDLKQARAFIVYKKDARGLRVGSTRTVVVAGKRIKCRVRRWSRGSRLLVPVSSRPLARVSARRLRRAMAE